MRVVIQRVSQASVTVEEKIVGQIKQGLMLLVGIHQEDSLEDVHYLAQKIAKLRIFEDEAHKMNRSIQEVNGEILSISQFTLHAETKKGNRPSFIQAARPELAIPLYEAFNQALIDQAILVQTGIFGADMKCELVNDGPVTIIMDSKQR